MTAAARQERMEIRWQHGGEEYGVAALHDGEMLDDVRRLLIESAALARQIVVDGPDSMFSDEMTDGEMLAYTQGRELRSERLVIVHIPWIEQHATWRN